MYRLFLIGFCLIISVVCQITVCGQSRTYVGLEAAVYEDQNSIGEDSGNSLNTVSTKSILLGVNIRRDLSKRWFLETGILYKVYYQSILFNQTLNYPYTLYAFTCVQVPLRIGYKIRLTERASFIPVPGIWMGYNVEPDYNSFGGATTSSSGTSIKYYAEGTHEQRFFILVNPSLALERVFYNSLILSFYVGRSWGLTEISELLVDYTIDNSSTYRGSIINQGNFFYGGISLKYPMGKIRKN